MVYANSRCYETDLEGYLQFFNGFRENIKIIDYEVFHEIQEEDKTVLCMWAIVRRVDGSKDQFEAVLLLEFNDDRKIMLWHEVYIKI